MVMDANIALAKSYAIRPLRWKREFQDWRQAYTAEVVGGTYTVVRVREECANSGPWETWHWEYSFREYYDEGTAECETPAKGKQLAQEDWLTRLLPALEALN